MSRAKLMECITVTLGGYGRVLGKSALEMWLDDLAAIDPVVAMAAFAAHRRDPDRGQFAPTAADIIRRVNGSNEERALMAWATVRGAVRQHGYNRSVDFNSPLVHGVLHEMGGWSSINDMTTFDVEARKAEFIKRFVTYASRNILPAHCPPTMVGLYDDSDRPARVALPFHDQPPAAITGAARTAIASATKALTNGR